MFRLLVIAKQRKSHNPIGGIGVRLLRNESTSQRNNEIMTEFAVKVYKAVLSIPLGQVRTYKWVAKKAGRPNACRAVGTILKNNRFPLIIPCHRVVKSSGDIGYYSFGGRKMKQRLLNLERQIHNLMV